LRGVEVDDGGGDALARHGTAKTPTTATPVPPPAPRTMAVYAPGGNVAMIAASWGSAGAKPLAWTAAALGASCQSSFVATIDWSAERTSVSAGLASTPVTP